MGGETIDAAALAAAAQALFRRPFDGVLAIEAVSEGARVELRVDGRADPPAVAVGPTADADCRWRGAPEAVRRVLSGARGLLPAYVSGRLDIAGDMALMARLEFSDRPAA